MANKQTHGQKIIDGLTELTIAADIANRLAPLDKSTRLMVLGVVDQVLGILDDRRKKKRR